MENESSDSKAKSLVEAAREAHSLEWQAGFAAGVTQTLLTVRAKIDERKPVDAESIEALWADAQETRRDVQKRRDAAFRTFSGRLRDLTGECPPESMAFAEPFGEASAARKTLDNGETKWRTPALKANQTHR